MANRLLLSAFILYSTTFVSALPPPVDPSKVNGLTDVYDVNFNDIDKGGCAKHQFHLNQAYASMLDVLVAANTAVESLRVESKPDSSDVTGLRDWYRKMQPFEAMFPFKPGQNPGSNAPETLYHKMRASQEDYPGMQTKKYRLRCNDDFLTWIKPGDENPDAPGRTLSESTDKEFPNGVYAALGFPQGERIIRDKEMPVVYMTHPICKGDDIAVTFSDRFLVVLCPAALDNRFTTFTDAAAAIREGQFIKQYTFSLAQTWLHELVHLVAKVRDQQAVNRLGIPKIGDTLAYDWNHSRWLVKWRKDKALSNPDNYANFAAAVYWGNWFWGDGFARTAPLTRRWPWSK